MAKGFYKEKLSDIHARNLSILKERIKNSSFSGCYLFYGDEEYTKNHYYEQLCKTSGDKSLNVKSIYGKEFTLKDFIDACDTYAIETFDMFAEDAESSGDDSKLRVVRLVEPDLSVLTAKDADYFIEFLEDLPEGAAVVFWFYSGNNPDFSKGIYKKLPENILVVNFPKEPDSSAVLITWILRHFSKAKLNVDRNVAVYLCSCVGNDMTTLKNEIDKCVDYLRFENRDTLKTEDIDFLCTKSSEAQIFDITTAAFKGNFQTAAKALKVLENNREKPGYILGAIARGANDLCCIQKGLQKGLDSQSIASLYKLNEYAVKKNLAVLSERNHDFKGNEKFAKTVSELCFEYDTKLKSSRTNPYALLLELVFKISTAGKI